MISGKGGTGKTSVVASLAPLAGPLVLADCDVDSANLALFFPGLDGAHQPLFSGLQASLDMRRCRGHGVCAATCRFDAVRTGPDGRALLDPFACEGCGACVLRCPEQALRLFDKQIGVWAERPTAHGPLVHAMLGVAQENTGRLVRKVRTEAVAVARRDGLGLVLIDGPPGIGQPVQRTIDGTDLVLAVAEGTASGAMDLERVLALVAEAGIPRAVLLNKADLDRGAAARIEEAAAAAGAPLVGRLPFDVAVPRALCQGHPPLAVAGLAPTFREIWENLSRLL